MHFDEIGTKPIDDFQVGRVVSVGVKVVLIGLLLVTLIVEDVAHLLEDHRVGRGQTQKLQVPLNGLVKEMAFSKWLRPEVNVRKQFLSEIQMVRFSDKFYKSLKIGMKIISIKRKSLLEVK